MDNSAAIAEETIKSADSLSTDSLKADLLEKHYNRTMTGAERFMLHSILKLQYKLGDIISEYRCCSCKQPLMYTWEWGFRCLYVVGGCGRNFR